MDNDKACLWSVLFDPAGNSGRYIKDASGCVFHFVAHRPVEARWAPDFQNMLRRLLSWKELAHYFELPWVDQCWDYLADLGPPGSPPPCLPPSGIVDAHVKEHPPQRSAAQQLQASEPVS